MVTIGMDHIFSSLSDCNNPLRFTHFCLNYSMSRTESIILVYAHYLSHCAVREVLPSNLKQRYSFPYGYGFNDAVVVEELFCRILERTLVCTGLAVLFVSVISGIL